MKRLHLEYCGLLLAASLLAGCGVLPLSQPALSGVEGNASVHGIARSANVGEGLYVSESTRLSGGPTVFGYPGNNRGNKPAQCTIAFGDGAGGIATDRGGNLLVPDANDTQFWVYQGPGMCGPAIGRVETSGFSVDIASDDAVAGKIIVGNYKGRDASSPGNIEICRLTGGCTKSLTNPDMFEVIGVALAKNGDCWASGYGTSYNATLTYFRHCDGSGQSSTGFENKSPGGLDIDKYGNLISVDLSQGGGFFVYKGCRPACTLVGGLFPDEGASDYGHVNRKSTEFATADYQYGQVDVYKYTPTKMTYEYSFDNGLSQQDDVLGAAYNPGDSE
jgi:hypothetical protein